MGPESLPSALFALILERSGGSWEGVAERWPGVGRAGSSAAYVALACGLGQGQSSSLWKIKEFYQIVLSFLSTQVTILSLNVSTCSVIWEMFKGQSHAFPGGH